MLTMNRATVLGHAGRDPEMRTLQSGGEVALFSLATRERFTRRDGTAGEATEWHAIVAFGNAAQTVRKMVRKGAAVLVEGRIATRTWKDRTGREHRTSEILVSGPQACVNVLTKRARGSGGDDDPPGGAAPAGAAKAATEDSGDAPADAAAVADGTAGSGADGDADTGTGAAADRASSDGAESEAAAPAEADAAGETSVAAGAKAGNKSGTNAPASAGNGPEEEAGPAGDEDAGPGTQDVQTGEAAGAADEDAGQNGKKVAPGVTPEGTASAEAASEEPETDTRGEPGPGEATGRAEDTSDGDTATGDAGDAVTGEADATVARDAGSKAVRAGVEGRASDAGHV